MRSRALAAGLAALLCVLAGPAAFAQTRQTDLDTPAGKFPLYVTAEYLGMAGLKTVIRVRLRAPELSMAAGKRGLTSFSGELAGAFVKGDEVVQAFKYPVSGEIGTRTTFQYAFLRSIEPGTYKLRLEPPRAGRQGRGRGRHRAPGSGGGDAVFSGHGADRSSRRCRPPRPSSSRTRPSAPRRGRAERS